MTVTELAQANPNLAGSLKAGQTLRLPSNAQSSEEAETIQQVAFTSSIRKPAQPARYSIKRGDTLHAIAQRFDVSLADLKAWNPVFKKSSKVRPGQTVVVRKP